MSRDPYARGGMFYSEPRPTRNANPGGANVRWKVFIGIPRRKRRPRPPRRSLLAWIVSGIALLLAVAVAAGRG